MTSRAYLFAACIALTLGTPILAQSTWTVGQDGNADFTYIQDAIDYATHYDTIEVAPGLYEENLNTRGKRITVVSTEGPNVTVIHSDWGTALKISKGETADTVIDGFQFSNCSSEENGCAISIRGASPLIKNCLFIENITYNAPYYGGSGGAVSVEIGFPHLENCAFNFNQSGDKGGALYITNKSFVHLVKCSFTSNQAPQGAAIAINYQSNVTLTACTFNDNIATYYGGAMYLVNDSVCQVQSGRFENNGAGFGGGAAWVQEASLEVTDSLFEENQSAESGAIAFINSPPCSIVESQFRDNLAGFGGGGNGGGGGPLMRNHENADAIQIINTPCEIQNTSFCGGTNFIYGTWNDLGGVTFLASCTYGACCSNDVCVDAEEETCVLFGGEYLGVGTMCDTERCPTYCLGDLDGNFAIDVDDLLLVISNWGPCP